MKPMRIQLSRRKGWRMPPNTVSVARTGLFGSPYVVVLDEMRHTGEDDDEGEAIMHGPWLCKIQPDRLSGWWFPTKDEAIAKSVAMYRWRLTESPPSVGAQQKLYLHTLSGKNLGCWCRLCPEHAAGKPFDVECPDCDPCHVDVLGPLANPVTLDGPR
jgi:hypothetical protein